jgi:hypothetical protein
MELAARVEPAARNGKGKKQTEWRQHQKHKKKERVDSVAKIEQIRHQEWILQQRVNKAATKKRKKKGKE